ncbi:MAG: AAA family ATPase [Candidatus Moduliflexus flocculans]|nr:AAA family ATPase [Candidatus Moduliflexus flocculans]
MAGIRHEQGCRRPHRRADRARSAWDNVQVVNQNLKSGLGTPFVSTYAQGYSITNPKSKIGNLNRKLPCHFVLNHWNYKVIKRSHRRPVFEFAGGITAIVGPNGSGKSNIADALRWVLGEQSYTLLRGKKTEDMIFNGSEHRARASMASAHILFDNTNGWLPVDFTEVAMTRRAYRDGHNDYLLNDQQVRLRDLNELLSAVRPCRPHLHDPGAGTGGRVAGAQSRGPPQVVRRSRGRGTVPLRAVRKP